MSVDQVWYSELAMICKNDIKSMFAMDHQFYKDSYPSQLSSDSQSLHSSHYEKYL